MTRSNGKKLTSHGADMLSRLGKFVDKLDTAESLADPSKLVTVRRVKRDLHPRQFSGEELKQIRLQIGVSQAVFAEFVGVGVSTIQDWEQARSNISGPVCRLLAEMQLAPQKWSKRVKELAKIDTAVVGGS